MAPGQPGHGRPGRWGAIVRRAATGLRTPGVRATALCTALTSIIATAHIAGFGVKVAAVQEHLVLVAVLTVLYAAAERFLVFIPVRRGSHTLTFSEIPLVLGLIWLDPAAHLISRVVGGGLGLLVFRGQRGLTLGFNTVLYATQLTVATTVFRLLAPPEAPLSVSGWMAAYAATLAADVVSIILVTAVIALHDDSQEWRRLLTTDIRVLIQLPLVTVSTTLALIAALLVREQVLASLLLSVLFLGVYQVFRRYAEQSHSHAQVEQLYDFNRAVGGLGDFNEAIRTMLQRVRDLVRAETAELVIAREAGSPVIRFRVHSRDDLTIARGIGDDPMWWQPALDGTPVYRHATDMPGSDTQPDGMAVPVAVDGGSGVLIVNNSLADIVTFTDEQLRFMQALAAHAAVALRNFDLVDRLRHAGLHDALTGLPNRAHLLTHLQSAIDTTDGVVGVLLMDLDRFKEINDALGHEIGDDLLRGIGRKLNADLGDGNLVARLGGDEFAVVVSGATAIDDVVAVAARLRSIIERPIGVGELTLTVQASIGICCAPNHGTDAQQLMRRADVAMYAAKHAHNGMRLYRAEDDQNTPGRLALLTELRSAIHEGGLDVVYQPKILLRTGRVVGAEALTRWRRADGVMVPPDEFIPLAERAGLIDDLTRYVLDRAISRCADWRRAGHELSVAVNISPQLLISTGFVEQVHAILQHHRLPATALTLEITESGVMEDPERSIATLTSLHMTGIALSIDDFGTGHSSLGRLAELPIHEMKIDKSFIRGLVTTPSRRAVTDAALHLGRSLDVAVVAEGVEEATEYEYLHQHGCDIVQGYYISKPLPEEAFAQWLVTAARERPCAASA